VAALPRNAQRVLAFLALQDSQVPRDHVAQCLWMDVPDERAAANFRTALWRIHQLGFPIIDSDRGSIRLLDTVQVDLRDVSAKARRLIDATSPDEVGSLTVDTLHAELLPGWYEDWVLLEQERYRQLRLHALEAMCRCLTVAHRYAEAIQAGLAAVSAEPLRETAQCALIAAYLEEGNVIHAIRQYQAYRVLLEETLGIEPGPTLTSLMRYVPVHRLGSTGGRPRATRLSTEEPAGFLTPINEK
jgi:DNA-binding SARP family transcriptional activator